MTDLRSSDKAEFKGLRRASFARALHVPAIGRRKHVEIVENANRKAPSSGNSTEKGPQRTPSPNPVTVSIASRGAEHHGGDEGAEIPDIPLRRAHVKRVSTDYSGASLGTLERMLTTGATPDGANGHHFGPTNPNAPVSSGEKSLPDVPEASSLSTIRPEVDSYLESVRETHSAPESTVGSVMSPSTYGRSAQDRSTIEPSITSVSMHTDFTSSLPALQTRGADEACDALEPLAEEDVEPGSFDLVIPATNLTVYNLERRSELLFSVDHLRIIFGDPVFLQRFLNFISIYRPQSMPLLRYYLEALKAIRALEWINSMISGTLRLDGHDFASKLEPTSNRSLLQKAEEACERLSRDELPAYITHVWTEFVETSMRRRITGTLPPHLHDMSDGLAEVFCITDPSRPDNPIVFTSEEFHRMTQYGLDYVIGRNCRFLQGPKTNPFAVQRIRDKLEQGKQHYETFLNYRRDGSPFMNLLMCAPLMDSTGIVRYYLGAQVDVSGLAKDCSGLESLRRLVDKDEEEKQGPGAQDNDCDAASWVDSGADVDAAPPVGFPSARHAELGERDHFRLLCEVLNRQELETVRRYGGRMHRNQQEQMQHESASNWAKGRVILHDNESSPPGSPRRQNNSEVHDCTGNITISSRATSPPLTAVPIAPAPTVPTTLHGPRVPTIYEHFLVVRPYPSLKILFASPSLRVPGILQSHLMGRIGGSKRIHEELEQAFALGQGVTAKVRWISGGVRSDSSSGGSSGENGGKEGRPRWIHCTPLIGSNGSVGVWMVVVVDEEADGSGSGGRLRRDAPTVNVPRARGDRRRNHDSLLALDTMSLNDFAAMNSLPQDEDLRQHVRHMYEETRRRERAAAGADGWDRKWTESRDGDRETIRVKEASTSGSWRGRVEELRKVAYSRSRSSSPFTLKIDD